jgi:hypothetical protein
MKHEGEDALLRGVGSVVWCVAMYHACAGVEGRGCVVRRRRRRRRRRRIVRPGTVPVTVAINACLSPLHAPCCNTLILPHRAYIHSSESKCHRKRKSSYTATLPLRSRNPTLILRTPPCEQISPSPCPGAQLPPQRPRPTPRAHARAALRERPRVDFDCESQ